MKSFRKFSFNKKAPTIEQVHAEMENHSGLSLIIRREVDENPRKSILERTGFDTGVYSPPASSYYISHPDSGYEIKITPYPNSKNIGFYVQDFNNDNTYLEGVLVIILIDLGGLHQFGEEQILKYIPRWANLPYLEAKMNVGFVL
ncbi:hypothetical protein [Pontibacter sp. G13]|uniref:hypothetical protein n=1 Tax=Pontibacter sp. G13 TaxID=3074898 RepID=UPI002889D33B|nr:hypothetical protein [Pontibacter sp. G13]WNJ19617.1 hypothetical protein RJD25_03940 [Pontibacter sp. G13]